MFKKIYIEITNNCNLKCDFCTLNKRENKFMSKEEFAIILDKVKSYTKYLYFHVLGEPLLHPKINEFIDLASKNFFVNITTNGYLIERIQDNKNIRQLNISLHSFNPQYHTSLNDYLDKIFAIVEKLKENTYIQYRVWNINPLNKEIIEIINQKYQVNLDYQNIKNNTRIVDNIFISAHEEFAWPSMNNSIYKEVGYCYALKDHIGILVNGDVIPCCLDADGIIKLGNIYTSSLDEIINSNIFTKMLEGFKNNQKCEELCRHCNFISK